MLNSSGMTRYRGYIIYGKSLENILKRVLNFVGGCKNIVADIELQKTLSLFCTDEAVFRELKSYDDVNNVIALGEEGKAVVFLVESPKENIYAVALIPIDKFNRSMVEKLRHSYSH